MARMGAPVDTAPRKGGASSERSSPWRTDRSQSPGLRNRTTSVSPLLGESSTSQRTYNPALIFALTYCVGYPVVIQTRNGESFVGILHTAGLHHGDSHFVLRKAKKFNAGGSGDQGEAEECIERLVIPSEECLQLIAKNLPRSQEPPRPLSSHAMPFPTNIEESTTLQLGELEEAGFLGDKNKERLGAGLFGRVLQPWVPESEGCGGLGDFDESKHEVGCWDQFEENEKRFGLKSDFNMDLYTTPLRVDESRYSVAQADELARLIRNSSTSNLHLQDERGQLAYDDSGLNDELLYSSVLPDNLSSKNRGRISKRDEILQTPPRTPPPSSTPKTRFQTGRQQRLIFAQSNRPMIINNRGPSNARRREVDRLVKEVSNAIASPNGSPIRASPLIGDQETNPKTTLQTNLEFRPPQNRPFLPNFDKYKRSSANVNHQRSREALVSEFREFSKDMESKLSRKVLGVHKSLSEETPKPNDGLTPPPEGEQIMVEDLNLPNPPKEESTTLLPLDEIPPDRILQRELPRLNVERQEGEEDDDGQRSDDQPNSGRGLNPHATPFNPGQGLQTKLESTLLMTDDDLNGITDRSPKGGGGSSSMSPKVVERALTPEEAMATSASIGGMSNNNVEREFPTPPPPPTQESMFPQVVIPPQARLRQPPPPPPPPPRLRTPPPPPPMTQVSEMVPTPPPPIMVPTSTGYRGTGRPNRQIPSPVPRRGPPPPPQPGIIPQDPSPLPPSMIMMPASRAGPPQGGPVQSGGGQGGVPHVSGPMHVPMHVPMHGGMAPPPPPPPYGYPPPDVNGQIPVVYQYPPSMAPPNGSGNGQNVPQGMMFPAYYPHPAMAQYAVPYGPPMMAQGPMPGQYVPMGPAPVNQQRPGGGGGGGGGGGRPRRPGGRRSSSFFGPSPRRP